MTQLVPVDLVVEVLSAALGETADGRDDKVARLLAEADLPEDVADRIGGEVNRLKTTAARWRRRGRELAALYSTAHELAQLRDVDELLERLVQRAHDLIGTDVTYLSEFHVASGELRVRTTLGTVAPSFPNLRVPPGMGLASMVVTTRSPQWTSRYDAMTQAPHDSGIDAAVEAEGLVSLLGVPLLAGDEVLGVLFAANRIPHTFTHEEISLLSAFADHAAVVLQTARLLADTRRSDAETRTAYGELSRHVEAMERASRVHEDLTGLVLQGGDATDVADALGRALRCTVTMLDAELRTTDDRPLDESAVREAVTRSRRSGRCVFLTGDDGRSRVVVAVVAGSTLLGALVLDQGALAFGPVEQRTAERAAQITALLLLKQDAVVEAEQRLRGDLLTDLLSGDPARSQPAVARAAARGVHVERMRSVVLLAVDTDHRRAAVRAAGRVAGPDGLVGEHANRVVALTPEPDPAAAARAVHAAVSRAVGGGVLAVGAATGPATGLHERCEAAESCLRVLPALGLRDGAVTSDEYLPYTALFGPGEQRVQAFVDATIGPVLEWDAERGRALLPTLAAYLDNRCSPVATARALHLHKNTVLQRLDRVSELLGARWQEPDHLFRIGIAVRLRLLGTTIGTP
ncbi:helix-turn-helix domain-containing protein [Saccharomonospora azurea]|uniref:helix-turn-helix domain-containing protein n=1 Tax=Saccharomonospora azurea TaxID=40988 RepID=UPI00240A5F60|nr:helix-turn-helix domain-containing protein [Saccharomonospora azurea]